MDGRGWIMAGALWAALGVGLGAFGAHALNETLEARGHLDTWRTAVDYHVWHALALVVYGVLRERGAAARLAGAFLLAGSVLFSGSLYALSLGFLPGLMGPLTPLGGVLLIAGWVTLAVGARGQRP